MAKKQKNTVRPMYAVFHGTKWGMTRDLGLALSTAQKYTGGEVFEHERASDDESWDAPTFRVLGKQIYPLVRDAVLPKAVC